MIILFKYCIDMKNCESFRRFGYNNNNYYNNYGWTKTGPEEPHGLQSKSLDTQSIYSWTIGNKYSTIGSSNSWFDWQCTIQIFLKYYSPETLLFPWHLTFFFSLLDCSLLFFPQRSRPPLSVSPASFIGLFFALIFIVVLLSAKYFSLLYRFPPLPYPWTLTLGGCPYCSGYLICI